MHDYKKLKVWQDSVSLVTEIYLITKNFPKEEKYGLISQINRSAVSVPSNIAEGAGRNTNGEFKHFIGNAAGSLYELETQLIVAKNINYLKDVDFELLIEKIDVLKKMLFKLISTLK